MFQGGIPLHLLVEIALGFGIRAFIEGPHGDDEFSGWSFEFTFLYVVIQSFQFSDGVVRILWKVVVVIEHQGIIPFPLFIDDGNRNLEYAKLVKYLLLDVTLLTIRRFLQGFHFFLW